MRLFAIMRREYITIIRDPRALLMVIIFPLFLMVLYGYGVTFDINNVTMGIYDQSKTETSRRLIDEYTSSGYFSIVDYSLSPEALEDLLISDKIIIGIIIPPEFASKIKANQSTAIQVLVNGTDANTASVALGYQAAIFGRFARENITLPPNVKLPAVVDKTRIWYNSEMRSANFIVPGIIAIIMMLLGAILTSTAIVREKENGAIEQIVASPVKSYEYILGKITPYVLLCLFDVALVVTAAYFIFDVPIKGNLLHLAFFTILFLANALGIGLFASAVSTTITNSQILSVMISLLPSILLSGFVFPIASMPKVVQAFTYLVPARYFLVILRGIFLKGVGFNELWPQGLFLVINATFFLSLAALKFKKKLD